MLGKEVNGFEIIKLIGNAMLYSLFRPRKVFIRVQSLKKNRWTVRGVETYQGSYFDIIRI